MLSREGRKQLSRAGKLATVGIEMALATAFGLFAGRWIDNRTGTAPLFMFIGLFLGIAAGFKRLWTLAKQHSGTTSRPTRPSDEP